MVDWTGTSEQTLPPIEADKTLIVRLVQRVSRHRLWSAARTQIRNSFDLRTSLAAGTVLVGAMLGAAAIHHGVAGTSTSYSVYMNGQYIGATKDYRALQQALATVPAGLKWDVHRVYGYDAASGREIAAEISGIVHPRVAGIEILVDGKNTVAVPSIAVAQKVLEQLKQMYASNQPSEKVSVLQHVEFVSASVPQSQLESLPNAVKYLTQGTLQQQKYIVSRGDSLWTIASQKGMSVSQLQAANPQITDENFVREGTELNITNIQPLITVQTVGTITRQAAVPFDTQYVDDANLNRGVTKVVTEGQNGSATQTVTIYKNNGQVVKEDVIQSVVTQQPVTQVVHRGTHAVNYGYGGSSYAESQDSGTWIWPTNTHLITSPFHEWRGNEYHPGVDIGAAYGAPIYASHGGRVISAGWNNGGYGNWVEIDNGNGVVTIYGHMSSVLVVTGQSVSQGQVIGRVGASGEATGPHLHYEVHLNGRIVAPYPYM